MSNDAQTLGERYIAVQESEEFGNLRRTFRGFVFPVTAFFLAWYFLYVLLSMFAPGFMGIKLVGNINVGLVLGLGQFVTTFAITIAYVRWAGRVFDPRAESLAEQVGSHETPEVDE